MTYNADCLIVTPERTYSATAAGVVTVTEAEAASAVRCMMTPVSERTTVGLTGEMDAVLYAVRLHTTAAIASGWRVLLRQDTGSQYLSYMVRSAHPNAWGHLKLTVERV